MIAARQAPRCCSIPITARSITEADRVVILFDAAGMATDAKPYIKSYAWFFQMSRGCVVKANAFFNAILFNDLWARVTPAE